MTPGPWFLASRPKTLPAAMVPVWVGSAPAMAEPGGFSAILFAATLLSCVCIQIATNLFNDAIDSHKGADTEARLGPRRVTATGLLSARAVMAGALGFCLLAAVFAIPLVAARGWPIVAIGAVSLVLAFSYTGGPFPLAYRGMGELFVILFFGFVAVLGSWYAQTGAAPGALQWLGGLQTGLFSSALIAVNNLRDIEEDRSTGKRTLAVRFGKNFARREIAAFCLAPVALAIAGALILPEPRLFWLAGTLPLGVLISVRAAKTEPGLAYNKFLALSALQLVLFGVLFTPVAAP